MKNKTNKQKQIKEAIELLASIKNGIDALSEFIKPEKRAPIPPHTAVEKIENKLSKKQSDN